MIIYRSQYTSYIALQYIPSEILMSGKYEGRSKVLQFDMRQKWHRLKQNQQYVCYICQKALWFQSNRILMACCPDTTQHSVACLISLSLWNNFGWRNRLKSLGARPGKYCGRDSYSKPMSFTTTCGSRTRFKDNDEIKQASESYLECMQQEFYLTGIKELFTARC